MLWLILGIICGLSFALVHTVSKIVVKKVDPLYLSYTKYLFISILFFPFVIILWPKFIININFIIALIGVSIIVIIAQPLMMISYKYGDLSKVVPLLSITPMITLLIAFLWLKELPNVLGIFGILLIVFGTYILNIEKLRTEGILGPIKALYYNKASRYMLLVAIIFGIGSTINKYAINISNVISQLFLASYFILLISTILLLIKDKSKFIKKTKKIIKSSYKGLILISLLHIVVIATHFTALSLTYTAYIIALKRTSAVFAVILAYYIFKEKKHFWTCFIGSLIAILGVVLLTIKI